MKLYGPLFGCTQCVWNHDSIRSTTVVLEGAIVLPQQDGDSPKKGAIGHGEIQQPIAVEIPHRHGNGGNAGYKGLGGLEGAIALPQQDGDGPSGKDVID